MGDTHADRLSQRTAWLSGLFYLTGSLAPESSDWGGQNPFQVWRESDSFAPVILLATGVILLIVGLIPGLPRLARGLVTVTLVAAPFGLFDGIIEPVALTHGPEQFFERLLIWVGESPIDRYALITLAAAVALDVNLRGRPKSPVAAGTAAMGWTAALGVHIYANLLPAVQQGMAGPGGLWTTILPWVQVIGIAAAGLAALVRISAAAGRPRTVRLPLGFLSTLVVLLAAISFALPAIYDGQAAGITGNALQDFGVTFAFAAGSLLAGMEGLGHFLSGLAPAPE